MVSLFPRCRCCPRTVPVDDIITSIEGVATRLPENDAKEIRVEVKKCIQKTNKNLRSNLPKEMRAAMKTLKEDKSIVILPADKGNVTVVMNREDYDSKMKEMVNGDGYHKVKTDPTNKIEKAINTHLRELFTNRTIDKTVYDKLRSTHGVAPQLYGLPKIHKPEVPMRPIVSCIGSPTYKLAKELTRIISPLAGNNFAYVKDSGDFVEKIRNMQLSENDILVSFDVKSLFTQVPIEEALEVIGRKLENHDDSLQTPLPLDSIKDLLRMCLTSTYFMWNEEFYEQEDGAAMGNPLSPVVANIYMEHFEEMALDTATKRPSTWLRYVDDTFVVWTGDRTELEEFLVHLNSLRNSIQFTMEVEENSSLPFLDVLVTKNGSGLKTSVYRKKTHTDRYIHYTSNHHPAVKEGTIRCLATRATRICIDPDTLTDEKQHLETAFVKNGYPRHMVRQALTKTTRRHEHEERSDATRPPLCVLPYVRGLSEKIKRICDSRGVKTVFKRTRTVRDMLTKVKGTHKNSDKGVIYRIPCVDCDNIYIGETGRPFHVRLKEHQRAVTQGDRRNANAVHHMDKDHRIDWNNAKIVKREEKWKERKILESIYIKSNSTFNLDSGFPLDQIWTDLITPSLGP